MPSSEWPRNVATSEPPGHDPECRDDACPVCKDVTGPLVDYERLTEAGRGAADGDAGE